MALSSSSLKSAIAPLYCGGGRAEEGSLLVVLLTNRVSANWKLLCGALEPIVRL